MGLAGDLGRIYLLVLVLGLKTLIENGLDKDMKTMVDAGTTRMLIQRCLRISAAKLGGETLLPIRQTLRVATLLRRLQCRLLEQRDTAQLRSNRRILIVITRVQYTIRLESTLRHHAAAVVAVLLAAENTTTLLLLA